MIGGRLRWAVVMMVASGGLFACAADRPPNAVPATGVVPASTVAPPGPASSRAVPSSAPVVVPTSAAAAAAPPLPSALPSAGAVVAAFSSSVRPIDDALAARMRTSWRPGCPVALASLRYVTVRHWGTDAQVHDGELVVHADHAEAVTTVFGELFDARFPIERMRLVDDYGGDDQASMRANNTSAFNCREVAGRPGVLSNHALGTAIDINPLVNPWVSGSRVDPPEGAPYADRSALPPGGIAPGDVVTRAFARIGWGWGGDWPDSKDWQHFSASGR
jgi:hypothetical protein